MAYVNHRLIAFYYQMLGNGDKRTEEWPLVYSPVPVTLIFLLYLCVVRVGPRLMKHKKPFDLKVVLTVYNFSMVGLCAYMFYEFLATSWLLHYSLICEPVDYSTNPLPLRIARVCWLYFISKIVELSDTIFIILRKKNSHLSFLHVYYHSTMIFWWAQVKYLAGGQTFFYALLNTLVHTVMYSYYGLAAVSPRMQKCLWWKRYLTMLQLAQFVIYCLHATCNLIAECDYPDSVNIAGIVYSVSLVILFSNFYCKNYLSKKMCKLSV